MSRARNARRFLAIVAGAVVLIIAAGLVWLRGVFDDERRLRIEEALRQIGIGLLIYAAGHDGLLPASLDELTAAGLAEAADLRRVRDGAAARERGFGYVGGLCERDPEDWIVAFSQWRRGRWLALLRDGRVAELGRVELLDRLEGMRKAGGSRLRMKTPG
jgi:hypothetical protein